MRATILTEPTHTTDPADWLVYADWRADRGVDAAEGRARAVARRLSRRGGKNLWLNFRDRTSTYCDTSRYGFQDAIPEEAQDYYSWSGRPGAGRMSGEKRFNPVEHPGPFVKCPELVAAYWNKIEELGRAGH